MSLIYKCDRCGTVYTTETNKILDERGPNFYFLDVCNKCHESYKKWLHIDTKDKQTGPV